MGNKTRMLLAAGFIAAAVAVPSAAPRAQTYWGSGASAPTTGDCDPAVQQRQSDQARSLVSSYAQLASTLYTPMPSSGFFGASCLSNLMSNGLNVIFSPPDINQIITNIENGLCQYAKSFVQQQVGSVMQSFSSSIPGGDIIPGVNLGSALGGFSVGPGGSGGISVNNQPVTGNLAGFWGSAPGYTTSYGSLFSGGSSSASGSGGWFSGLF